MEEDDDLFRKLSEDYRRGSPVSARAKQHLLERIAATPPPRRRGGFWTGLELRIMPVPAAGILAAAFLLGAVSMYWVLGTRLPSLEPAAGGNAQEDSLVPVQFVLIAPGARSVSLAGDFTEWDPRRLAMARISPQGIWSVTVRLTRGSHRYCFVVDDDQWVADPTAPLAPDDGFGARSSVVLVGDRET